MKKVFTWGGLASLCLGLLACQGPELLTLDDYNVAKYNLPTLSPGGSKTVSVGASSDSWLIIPVTSGTCYFVTATGLTGATFSIYHADRTTPYVTAVAASSSPGVFVTATENAFVKISTTVAAQVTLSCSSYLSLTDGVWLNDKAGYLQTLWYAFPVVAGNSYDFSMSNYFYGDGTKTADTSARIFHFDRTTPYTWSVNSAYSAPITFVATTTEIVFVAVTGYYSYYTSSSNGTFAIRLQSTPPPPVLTSGTWQNDTLSASGTRWYSFVAVAGTTYSISWNDSLQGNSTMTCDVQVSALHSDRVSYYFTSVDSGYTTPRSITPTTSETIYLKVAGFDSSCSGTFAIRFAPN